MIRASPPGRGLDHFRPRGRHLCRDRGSIRICPIPFAVSGQRQLQAPLSDLPKEQELFRIESQLPDHLPGMVHDPTRHLDQLPAEGGPAVMPKGFGAGGAEEDGRGETLSAGPAIQTEPPFPLLEEVLRLPWLCQAQTWRALFSSMGPWLATAW